MMRNIPLFCLVGIISAACSIDAMSIQDYNGEQPDQHLESTPNTDNNVGNNTNEIVIPAVPPVLNTAVYYGRSLLSGEELKAYDYMFDRFRNFESNRDIYADTAHRVFYNFTEQGIQLTSSSQVNLITRYIINDHPEFYQSSLSAARDLVLNNGYVSTFYNKPMSGVVSRDQFDAASQEIETEVLKMLSVLNPGMTDAQKIRALHDTFLNHVNYSMSSSHRVSDIYGALVQQRALCEGYARAFTYLLQRAGITAFYNTGEMRSSETTSDWGLHAWVIVHLEGAWYAIDITSDDGIGGSGYHHSYFLMGSTEFNKTLRYVDAAGNNQSAYPTLPTLSSANYPLSATAY
ncbi:MAG: transglutaminase domain-containing protein [Brevinema sp.]